MEEFDSSEEYGEILSKVKRFENMLSEKGTWYFDREEFQEIVDYYLSMQEYKSAETVLEYAFAQHPESQELKIAQVHILLAKGKFKEAMDLVKEIELILPDNSEVLSAKGSIYSRLKMSEKALACFTQALSGAEYKEDLYFLIAMEHQHNMEYEKAIKYHRLALRENSNFELSLYEINVCFDCLDDIKQAIKFYEKFLDETPYSETAWFNLGVIYTKQENHEKAIDAFEFALAINPFYSSALFNKANSLAAWGKYEAAIKCYHETIEHDFPTYITNAYIGECYERMEDPVNALAFFDKSLAEEENYPDSWLGKAIALDNLNQPIEAYNCIQRAINLDNSEPDYWFTCAEIEEKLGLIEEAIESMKTALEKDDTDVGLAIQYIQMIYRNLDIVTTKEATEEMLSLFPNDAKLLFFKCGLMLCIGKLDLAYQLLIKAIEIEPTGYQFLFDNFPQSKRNQHILEIIDEKSK